MPTRCKGLDCDKQAKFGLSWKKPTHCKKCADDDMVDVVSNRCEGLDCDKQPKFGMSGKKPIYCKKCADDDMVDVRSKRCAGVDCDKHPAFGMIRKKPTHCKKCADDDMVDVVNKRCEGLDCDKHPNFGMIWKNPTHCKKCADDDMVDVVHKRCAGVDCDKKPTHCGQCADDDMVDVVNKRCETCDSSKMNSKYNPNCAACHFYLHPDDPRIRNYKTKEQAFMSPLQSKYPEMILDRIVIGGCSKRRPDGLLDRLTHSVIIEIDEDQHVGYESICDNKRTMELFQDLGSRPIVFIRLNPDAYTLEGKRIKGVFSVSKTGVMTQNKKEFARRYECLLKSVESAIAVVPTKTVSSVKLYYSE